MGITNVQAICPNCKLNFCVPVAFPDKIVIETMVHCPNCKGYGKVPDHYENRQIGQKDCERCKGKGKI